MSTNTWNEERARSQNKKSIEICERFFAGRKRPEIATGQTFYDLCLAEYEVRKHLLTIDCFSSREALIAELRRLLNEPVLPSLLPCRADQYLKFQKEDIEVEIYNLMLEQNPAKKATSKSWFQRLFGRSEI